MLPIGLQAEIDSQLSAVNLFLFEHLHPFHSTLDVNEIRVGEASRLARSPIDRHPHIDDIFYAPEELVQIPIGHFKRHVANEKSLTRWVLGGRSGLLGSFVDGLGSKSSELNTKAAAFEDFLIHSINSLGGSLDSLEINVAEPSE